MTQIDENQPTTQAPVAAFTRKPEPTGPVAPKWPGLIAVGAVMGFGLVFRTGAFLVLMAIIASIVFHEFGHYITAKRGGIKVTRAFVGMGPTLWSIRRGETEYGIKAFPVGGFVRMIGMHNLDIIEDPADEPRTYRQQSFGRRMLVITAGSMTHFFTAIVLLFVIFFFHGQADTNPAHWHVSDVVPQSGASAAGLLPGDRIVAGNGVATDSFAAVQTFIRANPGKAVTLTIDRGGKVSEVVATIGVTDPQGVVRPFLGIGPQPDTQSVGLVDSATNAVTEFGGQSRQTFSAFMHILNPKEVAHYFSKVTTNPSQLSGSASSGDSPRFVSVIGVWDLASQTSNIGWAAALSLIVAVNISVGIFNLLPLLPLDGGHAMIAIYERVRSRKRKRYFADVAKLMPVAYATVFFLAILSLSAVYLDAIG